MVSHLWKADGGRLFASLSRASGVIECDWFHGFNWFTTVTMPPGIISVTDGLLLLYGTYCIVRLTDGRRLTILLQLLNHQGLLLLPRGAFTS